MRFYIYFDSDYELDADSIEEKNKVRTNLVFNWNTLTLLPQQYLPDPVCYMGYMYVPLTLVYKPHSQISRTLSSAASVLDNNFGNVSTAYYKLTEHLKQRILELLPIILVS